MDVLDQFIDAKFGLVQGAVPSRSVALGLLEAARSRLSETQLNDLDAAKRAADKPAPSDHLRRRLWSQVEGRHGHDTGDAVDRLLLSALGSESLDVTFAEHLVDWARRIGVADSEIAGAFVAVLKQTSRT